MEQYKINQYIDQLAQEFGRELSIGEQIYIQDLLESGESVETCRKYIKGEL